VPNVPLAPVRAGGATATADASTTFGQRRTGKTNKLRNEDDAGGVEISWVPSAEKTTEDPSASHRKDSKPKRKGVETFGAGMERGGVEPQTELAESERKGRTQRRKGIRSGSKNVFRSLDKK
jgi:ribosome biogenesis protein ENP2